MEELEKLLLSGEDGKPLAEEEPRRDHFLFPKPVPTTQLLLKACFNGDIKEIKRLINADKTCLQERDSANMGPLLTAVHRNHLKAVKTILDLGADINEVDETKTNAICYAVVLGYLDIVKLLVKRGMSPTGDLSVPDLNRPIHFAAVGNRIEIAKYLMSKGATLLDKGLSGGTPLRSAVIANQVEFAKWTISLHPETLKALDDQDLDIAPVAVETGATSIVKWLLEEGYMDFSVRGGFQMTFVQMVARYGAVELLTWILDLRSKKEARDALDKKRAEKGVKKSLFELGSDQTEFLPLSERWKEQRLTPLQLAAQEGNQICIEMLLDQGLDVKTEVDHSNTNILMWIAQRSHLHCISIAIKAGCSVSDTDDSGCNPLMLACHEGHLETAKLLIKLGADADARDNLNSSPFYMALSNGHVEVAQFLISLGVRIDNLRTDTSLAIECSRRGHLDALQWWLEYSPNSVEDCEETTDNIFTAAVAAGKVDVVRWLHQQHNDVFDLASPLVSNSMLQAAANGHLTTLQFLLNIGVSLHSRDNLGNTSIIYGANYGHCEVVEWLIDVGKVDMNLWSSSYQAIHFAARRGHVKVVELLLKKGANINTRTADTGETLLHLACLSGSLPTVDFLLKGGLKPTKHTGKDKGKNYPILCASLNGSLDIMKLLVEHGSPVDVRSKNGWSIINHGAASGFVAILEYGLQQGLPLTDYDKSGYTPVLLAAYNGQIEALDWLLERGATIKDVSSAGTDMFGLAAHGNRVELMEHLTKKYKMRPTSANQHGMTPLLQASKMGHLNAVKWLLEQPDVNIHAADYEGLDSMFHAALKGSLPVVKWLHKCAGFSIRYRHDKTGFTPFLLACRSENLELINWMLRNGCSVRDVDYDGLDVVGYSRSNDDPAVHRFLSGLLHQLEIRT